MSRSALRTSLASLAMAIAAGVTIAPAVAAPDAPPRRLQQAIRVAP